MNEVTENNNFKRTPPENIFSIATLSVSYFYILFLYLVFNASIVSILIGFLFEAALVLFITLIKITISYWYHINLESKNSLTKLSTGTSAKNIFIYIFVYFLICFAYVGIISIMLYTFYLIFDAFLNISSVFENGVSVIFSIIWLSALHHILSFIRYFIIKKEYKIFFDEHFDTLIFMNTTRVFVLKLSEWLVIPAILLWPTSIIPVIIFMLVRMCLDINFHLKSHIYSQLNEVQTNVDA